MLMPACYDFFIQRQHPTIIDNGSPSNDTALQVQQHPLRLQLNQLRCVNQSCENDDTSASSVHD